MFDTSSRVPLDKEEVFNGQLLWGGASQDNTTQFQGCRFVPNKHIRNQVATDGDLNIGETQGLAA